MNLNPYILTAALLLTGCDTTGHLGQGSGVTYERPAFGFGETSATNIERVYHLDAARLTAYCDQIGAAMIHGDRGCAKHLWHVDDANMADAADKDYRGYPSLCVLAVLNGDDEAERIELQQARATCMGWKDSRDFWAAMTP